MLTRICLISLCLLTTHVYGYEGVRLVEDGGCTIYTKGISPCLCVEHHKKNEYRGYTFDGYVREYLSSEEAEQNFFKLKTEYKTQRNQAIREQEIQGNIFFIIKCAAIPFVILGAQFLIEKYFGPSGYKYEGLCI